MLDVLGVLISPLVGVIGSISTAVTNYQMKKLEAEIRAKEMEHELAMLQERSIAMRAEAEANLKITETVAQGAVDLAEANAFARSLAAADSRSLDKGVIETMLGKGGALALIGGLLTCGLGFADVVKALMRPLGTIYISGLATWITWAAWRVLQETGAPISGEQAVGLWQSASYQVMALFVTLWTWWFGDRRLAKLMAQKKPVA